MDSFFLQGQISSYPKGRIVSASFVRLLLDLAFWWNPWYWDHFFRCKKNVPGLDLILPWTVFFLSQGQKLWTMKSLAKKNSWIFVSYAIGHSKLTFFRDWKICLSARMESFFSQGQNTSYPRGGNYTIVSTLLDVLQACCRIFAWCNSSYEAHFLQRIIDGP